MKLTYIILMLFIANTSLGGIQHTVTSRTIDNFPMIAFVEEVEGETTYRLYFRDTGNLKGLGDVGLAIQDADSQVLFSGGFRIYDDKERGVHIVQFSLLKSIAERATVTVMATTGEYCGAFYYVLPVSLIRDHFKNNISSVPVLESAYTPAIEMFLMKEFKTDRDK